MKQTKSKTTPIPQTQGIKCNASKCALSPYPSCSVKLSFFVCFSFSVSTQISISLSRCRALRICALWLLCHAGCLCTAGPGNPAQSFQACSSAAGKPQESWIEPTASRFVVPAEWWMQQGLPRLLVLELGPWGARAGSRWIWQCEQGKTLLSAEGAECLCPEFPSGCPTAAVVLPLRVFQPHGRGAMEKIGCISPVLFILLSRAASSECYSSLTTQNQGGRGGPVSSNTPHSQYNFIEMLFVGLIHYQCWRITVILGKNQSSQHHKALLSYQIPDLPNIWSFSRAIERFGTSNRKKLK